MNHSRRIHHPTFTIYLIAICALLTSATSSFSQNFSTPPRTTLAPFAAPGSTAIHPAWQLTGLPNHKAPLTDLEASTLNNEPTLKLRTQASYGVLTHAWQGPAPAFLSWRWRLDQPLAAADIRTKAGDDAALKVCVMFDQPLADIPFFQRAALGLARSATGQNLPNATVCYVWDSRYPALTNGSNPYSARVRYIILNGPESAIGQWTSQRRRVADDFALLFGGETQTTPPITAIAVGADSDNTQGSSLGYIAGLHGSP